MHYSKLIAVLAQICQDKTLNWDIKINMIC